MVAYSDSGISMRTNVYAERTMLAHAMPIIVLDRFGTTKPMPKNKGQIIKFRRPNIFTAKTIPLVEGVTPPSTSFSYTDVTATLKQYGDVIEVTDQIEDTHEDPVINDAAAMSGENIGRTIEALLFGILRAGTNVFYANGANRAAVNTVLSLNKQRAVVRALKAQKAMPVTTILSSSMNYATRAIEAGYVAVCHSDVEADVRNLAGFIPVAQYGSRQPIHDWEIGSVENVRYISSPDLPSFPDAGGAKGSTVSTTGTSSDVYPILFFGKDAYASVPLRGAGAIEPSIIRPGQKDKSDPLGQRGYIGWKMWWAAVITNQAWMARLEVAVSAL